MGKTKQKSPNMQAGVEIEVLNYGVWGCARVRISRKEIERGSLFAGVTTDVWTRIVLPVRK